MALIIMMTGCWQEPVIINVLHIPIVVYRVVAPDDEQQASSKHIEGDY